MIYRDPFTPLPTNVGAAFMLPYRTPREKTNGRDKARPYYQSASTFPINVGGAFMHPIPAAGGINPHHISSIHVGGSFTAPARAPRDENTRRDKSAAADAPCYQSASTFPINVGGAFMHPYRTPREKTNGRDKARPYCQAAGMP